MLYELILINEIEQRAKIIFLSVCYYPHSVKLSWGNNFMQFNNKTNLVIGLIIRMKQAYINWKC